MAETTLELDCAWRVEDVITRHPSTRMIFDHYGIDSCCGGTESVTEAATRSGMNAELLCASLRAAARQPWLAR